MAWTTARDDLRTLLNDGAHQNLVKDQMAFGAIDGANQSYLLFQDRILTDPKPRVFLDGVEMTASGVTVTDAIRGEIFVSVPPAIGCDLRVSYEFQQFTDGELDTFLLFAAQQCNATTAADVPEGLRFGALYFAASMACQRLSIRWQQRKSEQFQLQDQPQRTEAEQRITFYANEASRLQKEAIALRRSFYEFRMDRGRSPAFGILERRPLPYVPRR